MMDVTLVSADQVPRIFCHRLKNRQENEAAFVASMSAQFHNNPIIDSLMKYGSKQDAVIFDYFGHRHGNIPTKAINSEHENARSIFQKNFSGSYTVVGAPPRVNFTNSTILNRSHIKAYAVGNRILSLGGVNCTPSSYYEFIDVMLDFRSDKFITNLRHFFNKGVHIRREGAGTGFWLNEQNEVLIDYGRRNNRYGLGNKSVILTSLINDLSKNPISATLSSTCIPFAGLDRALFSLANKGRTIKFYTNYPSKFNPPFHSAHEKRLQYFYALRAKTPWIDKRPDKFNHLKAAIITYLDGDKVAYVGSHNFNQMHVWAGTTDICLRSTDFKLISQLEKFIEENLESPS